jgi:hypothetical protein
MATFLVTMAGTGIKVPSVPHPVIGFLATRRVEASNEMAAVKLAKSIIRKEWNTNEYKAANIGDDPLLEVEKIRKLTFLAKIFTRAPTKGYTFYTHE